MKKYITPNSTTYAADTHNQFLVSVSDGYTTNEHLSREDITTSDEGDNSDSGSGSLWNEQW